MIVVLFRSRLTPEAGDEYVATDEAPHGKGAGCARVSWTSRAFTAADGERLTIVWWKDLETLRDVARGSRASRGAGKGPTLWYRYYDMEVAEVVRQSRFSRQESPATSVSGQAR